MVELKHFNSNFNFCTTNHTIKDPYKIHHQGFF